MDIIADYRSYKLAVDKVDQMRAAFKPSRLLTYEDIMMQFTIDEKVTHKNGRIHRKETIDKELNPSKSQ